MTVKELIEKLQGMPQEVEVLRWSTYRDMPIIKIDTKDNGDVILE